MTFIEIRLWADDQEKVIRHRALLERLVVSRDSLALDFAGAAGFLQYIPSLDAHISLEAVSQPWTLRRQPDGRLWPSLVRSIRPVAPSTADNLWRRLQCPECGGHGAFPTPDRDEITCEHCDGRGHWFIRPSGLLFERPGGRIVGRTSSLDYQRAES